MPAFAPATSTCLLRHRALRSTLAAFVYLGACSERDGVDKRLLLQEAYARDLAPGTTLSAAVVSTTGTSALFGRKSPRVTLVHPTGQTTELSAGEVDGVVAAAALSDSAADVLTVGPVELRRLRVGRLPERIASLPQVYEPQAAVRIGDEWLIGLLTLGGAFEVHRLSDTLAPRALLRLPPTSDRSGVAFWAHMSPADAGTIVTLRGWPYTATVIDVNGRVVRQMQPDTTDATFLELVGASRARTWVSNAVVAFEDGYVQTLADLTSDRRVLLLYDQSGALQRHTTLSTSLGFFGATHRDSLLHGIRRTDRVELVAYRWRWGDHITHPGELR